MNDLRTAAQQALEALERYRQMMFAEAGCRWDGGDAAITALRAALAQQKDPTDPGNDVDVLREHVRHLERRVRQLHAQQDEPAQEPVAWRYKPMIGSSWSLSDDGYYISCKRDKGYIVDSLYTAPPRRTMVPLTEGEIVDAVRESDFDWQAGWTLDEHEPNRFTTLVRAVEKASWEKHHGKA